MYPYPCTEEFRRRKDCALDYAYHISSNIDEAVPIFLAMIEVSNMVEKDVPKYGL